MKGRILHTHTKNKVFTQKINIIFVQQILFDTKNKISYPNFNLKLFCKFKCATEVCRYFPSATLFIRDFLFNSNFVLRLQLVFLQWDIITTLVLWMTVGGLCEAKRGSSCNFSFCDYIFLPVRASSWHNSCTILNIYISVKSGRQYISEVVRVTICQQKWKIWTHMFC